jgi:uncharacterized protein
MNRPDIHVEKIQELCRQFHVQELYVFGSVLREDFSGGSDIDFAVRFHRTGFAGSFDQYFDFKAELEKIVGRTVDLTCLSVIRNQVFRDQLEATKDLVYAA